MKNNEFQEREILAKYMSEMTLERRIAVEQAFKEMANSNDGNIQPPMRMMQFGGGYSFDSNRTQIELEGTFSKADLMRIALTMD